MTGPMANLQDSIPFEEGKYAQDPVLPSAEGNGCRDQIVGESKLMVEQAEEKPKKGFHRNIKKGFDRGQTLVLRGAI